MAPLRWSSPSLGIVTMVAGAAALFLLLATPGARTTDNLLPHGFCYAWDPRLVRLHLVSDVLIGLAYLAIPVALVHFIRRRTDLPFHWMFLLFGLFIVACGTTHWMEVWTLWNPNYWLAGGVKAVTAAASVPTAILLFLLIPKAMALPSIAQLEAAKRDLEREIVQRRQAESELEKARRDLEQRVEARTAELTAANAVLERQRADLAQADQAKSDFLAILSHELRNPVHAIRTGAWAVQAANDPDAQQHALAAIERQVGKLALLLEELLDVVTVARKARLDLAHVDLRTVAAAAIETTRDAFDGKRQALHVQMPAVWLPVLADAGRLEQAIANVLSNASKYTPAGGNVTVTVAADGDAALVRVRDDGLGIAPEDQPYLFRLFGRGHRAHRAASDGLGVGLYIAHGLVEAHGGDIAVASEGPGHGSEFALRLPRAEAGAAIVPGREAPVAAMRPASALRILVVDDNRDGADSLGQVLRVQGHDVQVRYDGRSALAALDAHPADVTLLDIGLPDMSGYEVAAAMLARESGRPPVCIAITGWGAVEDRAKAQAAGFSHHLTKPVDPRVLMALLSTLAAGPRS